MLDGVEVKNRIISHAFIISSTNLYCLQMREIAQQLYLHNPSKGTCMFVACTVVWQDDSRKWYQ